MRIHDLRPGQLAVVTAIGGSAADEQRLREHGIDEGLEVELLHRAVLGADPVAIRVGNACVAMRRALAGLISVDPVEAEILQAAE